MDDVLVRLPGLLAGVVLVAVHGPLSLRGLLVVWELLLRLRAEFRNHATTLPVTGQEHAR